LSLCERDSLSEDLRKKLIDIGSSNPLFTIRPGQDCDLYLEHNIVDAEYYGVASKEKVMKRYEAKMWLVEEDRTVKYREIIQEKDRSAGVLPAPKMSVEKSVFKGKVLFKKEKGVGFGFKKPADASSFGKVYQYDFDVRRIRDPVKQLVEANGLDVKVEKVNIQFGYMHPVYGTTWGTVYVDQLETHGFILDFEPTAPSTTFTVNYYQAQFQWRTPSWGGLFGAWSSIYQNYATSDEFTLTGNVLHMFITYAPSVTNLQGDSSNYVYNKKEGRWIQKEGTIQYTSPYSGLTITEYWRGYLEFAGTPSASSFAHGVGYQWGYVYLPQSDEAIVKAKYPYAIWDDVMQAWLVGFSIYLWDTGTQSYVIPFPDPFIEPVPASNYNPSGH